jgi:hypothetical protein
MGGTGTRQIFPVRDSSGFLPHGKSSKFAFDVNTGMNKSNEQWPLI